MDFRNYWLDIKPDISYEYNVICPQCGNSITIIQKNNKCMSVYIKYIFEKIHIINNYSSYYENINNDFIVDIEILNNKPCITNKITI